jgi:hypothetical protein
VQYPASLRNLTTRSDTVDDGGRGIGHKAGAIVFSAGRAKLDQAIKSIGFTFIIC